MKQDIVDYLRDQRSHIARADEAADEIMRLRAELDEEEKVTAIMMGKLKKIAAHPDTTPLLKAYARGELDAPE